MGRRAAGPVDCESPFGGAAKARVPGGSRFQRPADRRGQGDTGTGRDRCPRLLCKGSDFRFDSGLCLDCVCGGQPASSSAHQPYRLPEGLIGVSGIEPPAHRIFTKNPEPLARPRTTTFSRSRMQPSNSYCTRFAAEVKANRKCRTVCEGEATICPVVPGRSFVRGRHRRSWRRYAPRMSSAQSQRPHVPEAVHAAVNRVLKVAGESESGRRDPRRLSQLLLASPKARQERSRTNCGPWVGCAMRSATRRGEMSVRG